MGSKALLGAVVRVAVQVARAAEALGRRVDKVDTSYMDSCTTSISSPDLYPSRNQATTFV